MPNKSQIPIIQVTSKSKSKSNSAYSIRVGVFLAAITSSIQATEHCGDAINSAFHVQASCCFDFDSDPDFDLDYQAQQNKSPLGMTKAGPSGPGSLLLQSL